MDATKKDPKSIINARLLSTEPVVTVNNRYKWTVNSLTATLAT